MINVFDNGGRKPLSQTAKNVAVVLVNEGRARWINDNSIELFWKGSAFSQYIYNRDSNICHYCGRECKVRGPNQHHYSKNFRTIDHIKPESKGGRSTPVNCVTACGRCNNLKGSMNYAEFIYKYPDICKYRLKMLVKEKDSALTTG